MDFKTSLTIGDQDLDLTVEFDYHRATRGSRDKWGAPLEPDEPAEIEIIEVKDDATGEEIDLSDADRKRIEERIWSKIEDVQREPAELCP